MSNLLFDEPPQMFQPRLAAAFNDVNEAIVLQQIHYWLKRTSNVRDGRKWVYNSMANWQKQFYWIKSRSTLTKIFKDLVNRGLLIEANYNKAKFDRTKWYTIDYDAFHEFEQALYRNCTTSEQELDNATSNSCTTYTIDYTETTTDIGGVGGSALDDLDVEMECHRRIQPVCTLYEQNVGKLTGIERQDLLYEYVDWYKKGVAHEEIVAIFSKAVKEAVVNHADAPAKYMLKILKRWLENNILSVDAVDGENKRFEANKQQRNSGYNNNSYTNKSNEAW